MTTLNLLGIVYGSCSRDPENDERFGAEQRRAEITLNPIIPTSAKTLEQKQKWVEGFLQRIGRDMKHTRNWRCEFCKKHGRETVWMNSSWIHLTPPKINSYIRLFLLVHGICDAGKGPCYEQLRGFEAQVALMTGFPPSGPPLPKTQKSYPMSASCIVCNNEASESRKNLKQCGRLRADSLLQVRYFPLNPGQQLILFSASSASARTGRDTKSVARP
ncbi:hypothetical protein B0H16DRAFT_1341105 [Mycena metata]|uniref:Uncharacterized protein n=1 Tax=Mycena metata TaxID=1033252 RepID=A0AAD7MF01_9AGAR|nr:hypothetical protein B0H16DRAFT_1341105 [Mycena metata]